MNIKKVLARLETEDFKRKNGSTELSVSVFDMNTPIGNHTHIPTYVQQADGKQVRWVPFKDMTRLLHIMFCTDDDELLQLFREMGTPLTRLVLHLYVDIFFAFISVSCREEVDDPMIKSKKDLYWQKIEKVSRPT